ncbi:MAG: D-alanine--D-alanine ligase [Patescibacteria group bacterium]
MDKKNEKLRIGIIFGGKSSEKEVSLEGGRNVYYKIPTEKYEKIPIFVDSKLRLWKINDFLIIQNTTSDLEALVEEQAERIPYEKLPELIDFAFVIGHGKYLEDGCFQGLLEILNIPYNGPGVLGAALGMNKYIFRKILTAHGIKVPKYLALKDKEWASEKEKVIEKIKKEIGFPCLVKPSREGCSTGISVVRKEEQLPSAIENAFQWDNIILVDEYIENAIEITCSVLGNEELIALPLTETPWQQNLEYLTLLDKFLPGGAEMITPARLDEVMTKKAKETAIKVCQILDLKGYPRIDMFIKDGEVIVLEPNTLPGVTPSTMVFHQAAEIGMSPEEFLDKIIQLGIEAHRKKKGPL